MRVKLERRDCPHLADAVFHALLQGTGLVVSVDKEQDALGSHDSADAHRERSLGDLVDVVAEETGIGDDGVLSEGFHAGA